MRILLLLLMLWLSSCLSWFRRSPRSGEDPQPPANASADNAPSPPAESEDDEETNQSDGFWAGFWSTMKLILRGEATSRDVIRALIFMLAVFSIPTGCLIVLQHNGVDVVDLISSLGDLVAGVAGHAAQTTAGVLHDGAGHLARAVQVVATATAAAGVDVINFAAVLALIASLIIKPVVITTADTSPAPVKTAQQKATGERSVRVEDDATKDHFVAAA